MNSVSPVVMLLVPLHGVWHKRPGQRSCLEVGLRLVGGCIGTRRGRDLVAFFCGLIDSSESEPCLMAIWVANGCEADAPAPGRRCANLPVYTTAQAGIRV